MAEEAGKWQADAEASDAEMEKRYGVTFVDLKTFKVDEEVLKMLPDDFMRENEVCPLFRTGNTIALAMADPGNIFVIDEVRRLTGLEVEPMVCRKADLALVWRQDTSERG
jgi:type IV pilus assembly protein PilB